MPSNQTAGPTRVASVMAEIQGRIAARRLAPGARLPSVRDLAATLGLSKSTVVEAYDRLVAEGAITARRGSGFFVAGGTRPLALRGLRPELDRAIDPLWVSRLSFGCGPEVLKPGSGMLPPDYMPDAALQKALRHLARTAEPEARTGYGDPLGYAPLRELIAHRLGERGVAALPDDVLLTHSASHSIDLLLRFLIEPGDTVLVDDPCYFNFLALLLSHRVRTVGVPYEADGPDVAALARAVEEHRPRLYLTTGGFHNPTGGALSPAKAHRVLKIAERAGLTIVEDDTFADFEEQPGPRLAGFDGLDGVVQVGSYSKTVSSSLRCGFMAVRADWMDPLIDLKLSTALGGGFSAATVLHHVLTDGGYRRHMDALRVRLARDRGVTLRRARACGLTVALEPRGGPFVWAALPDGIDAAEVARLALAEGVLFAPGNVFSASHAWPGHLRLNVARTTEPKVWEVLSRAIGRAGRLAA